MQFAPERCRRQWPPDQPLPNRTRKCRRRPKCGARIGKDIGRARCAILGGDFRNHQGRAGNDIQAIAQRWINRRIHTVNSDGADGGLGHAGPPRSLSPGQALLSPRPGLHRQGHVQLGTQQHDINADIEPHQQAHRGAKRTIHGVIGCEVCHIKAEGCGPQSP